MKISIRPVLKELLRNKVLYLMAVPGVVFFLLFNYLPMFGIIIAFKDFNFRAGILGSKWVGFKNFEFFFRSEYAWLVTKNTLILNSLFIATGVVLQVGFALMLNEVKNRAFKRLSQSFMFFPYFISWIIVSVFSYNLFHSEYGALNSLLKWMGLNPVSWYSNADYWTWIMVVINDWKWTGFGVIVYLAALAGINEELYEAARIDGASRWKQTVHISIPLIMPTVTVLTLLSIGRILNSDFGMIYGIVGDNSMLYRTTNVIDTFVFRALRQLGDIGMASAAGFYQSVVGFVLVLASNYLTRRYSEEGALF